MYNNKSVYLTTGHNFVSFDVDPFYGAAGGLKKLEVIIWISTCDCDTSFNSCMLGNFLSSADIFQHYFFQNILEMTSECQTAWIQIKPGILSGLIWVQTV